jgi:hypothetical protein
MISIFVHESWLALFPRPKDPSIIRALFFHFHQAYGTGYNTIISTQRDSLMGQAI